MVRLWERLIRYWTNYEFIYFIETAKAGSLSFCFLFVYCTSLFSLFFLYFFLSLRDFQVPLQSRSIVSRKIFCSKVVTPTSLWTWRQSDDIIMTSFIVWKQRTYSWKVLMFLCKEKGFTSWLAKIWFGGGGGMCKQAPK